MTDGAATGWQHAVWLLGWLLGALPVLALLAAVVALVLVVDVPHRVRVLRLRREMRRSGRAHVTDAELLKLKARAGIR